MRTDQNNNPTAFTTSIAINAGLVQGTDYEIGTVFEADGRTFYTAKLLGDPLAITIKVIDSIGFRTLDGQPRWIYISMPHFLWLSLTLDQKINTIGWMYQQEGGVTLRSLFPHYGEQ